MCARSPSRTDSWCAESSRSSSWCSRSAFSAFFRSVMSIPWNSTTLWPPESIRAAEARTSRTWPSLRCSRSSRPCTISSRCRSAMRRCRSSRSGQNPIATALRPIISSRVQPLSRWLAGFTAMKVPSSVLAIVIASGLPSMILARRCSDSSSRRWARRRSVMSRTIESSTASPCKSIRVVRASTSRLSPAGDKRDVLARTTRIDLQGEAVLLSIVRDITERRRAQRLLEESEQRLARIIEGSPEAITIASTEDGTFIAVNPASQRLSGWTRDEMIGRSAVAMGFWPDLEERQRLMADLQRDEMVHGRELRLQRKDGQVRDVLASAALIDSGGQRVVLFQGIDITERKNAEKALREHQELLRELSAHHESVREGERAHIAREIHDEMGQALTALKMDLSVIGLESAKKAPRVAAQVQDLKQRVDGLIQTVRDVATALRPAALDLGILAGVEWLVDEFQRRNGITCSVKVENSEVDLPEDRAIVLFRILQESLTNIARHAGARNVEILLRRDATHVRLDVKDDGKGFEPEAAGKRKTFGLLGMRERVIMLHGSLSITSVPGEGTQVSVSIPVQRG